MAGHHESRHCPGADGGATDERRQEPERDADRQRKRQRVRCAAMTPFVSVSDAKPKADHVGIRKKRERRPGEHRSPRGTLRRAVGPIDTGRSHADREVTKARHSFRSATLCRMPVRTSTRKAVRGAVMVAVLAFARAAAGQTADDYRGGWRTDSGEAHTYEFSIRGTTVRGIYCTYCADATTLAFVDGTFGPDGIRFEVTHVNADGSTAYTDKAIAKFSQGRLISTSQQ